MDSRIDALVFSLELNARYHTSRRDFFELVAQIVDVVSLAASGGLVLLLVSATPDNASHFFEGSCAVVLLLMSILSVVGSPGKKATVHQDFASRFRRLKSEVEYTEATSSDRSQDDWVRKQMALWSGKRSEIEDSEPPIFCALHDEKRYETAVALGRPITDGERPGAIKRFFRHIIRFDSAPNV